MPLDAASVLGVSLLTFRVMDAALGQGLGRVVLSASADLVCLVGHRRRNLLSFRGKNIRPRRERLRGWKVAADGRQYRDVSGVFVDRCLNRCGHIKVHTLNI